MKEDYYLGAAHGGFDRRQVAQKSSKGSPRRGLAQGRNPADINLCRYRSWRDVPLSYTIARDSYIDLPENDEPSVWIGKD